MTQKPHSGTRWKVPANLAKKARTPEKLTVGVPLVKLIKRKLSTVPEVVMLSESRSFVAEKFRRLKTILEKREDEGPQAIVITSSIPNEGKSFVSMNLALAFAGEKRREVLLIDADLRRPTIHNWLSPVPSLGLSDILEGRTELEHVLLSLENSPLKILPAGTLPREPAELLASDTAKELFSSLRQQFRQIVVDSPPLLPFSDADIIGSHCDGSLFVVRSGRTATAAYNQAQSMMTSTPVLGVVLNDVPFTFADWNLRSSKYYNSYYGYYDETQEK